MRYIDRIIIIINIIIVNADGSVFWDLRLFYCLAVDSAGAWNVIIYWRSLNFACW
jgi:hypothetical protein